MYRAGDFATMPDTESTEFSMHRYSTLIRLSTGVALSALLFACSSTPTYNPTTFPYVIDQDLLDNHPVKTVVITHVNIGLQSRNYLKKEAPRIAARPREIKRRSSRPGTFSLLADRRSSL